MASLSQGRTAAAQCGLFTYKSVPVIFEPPCITIAKSTNEKLFTATAAVSAIKHVTFQQSTKHTAYKFAVEKPSP